MSIPYIEFKNTPHFVVNDQPFLALAGEVHNSSCSSMTYFEEKVLSRIQDIPLNTLLLPIYFEDVEKEEGVYCIEKVQQMIDRCRQYDYKIIFLWYGLWKNGLSTYIPQWMKLDRDTYPFCRQENQKPLYTISPLCQKAIEKDAKAIQQVMSFIKKYDAIEQTVIMLQIENEVGLLESDRDYSSAANLLFHQDIPEDLQTFTQQKGTWQDVFLSSAPEMFMAYHYAKAIETIASSLKQVYPLPLMMNAWIKKENELPGKYPSGGPIIENIHIYQAFAPSIDVFAPDIYVDTFEQVCDAYAKPGVLAIPETRQDILSMSHIIYAIANYPLICFSPFGIEDFYGESESSRLLDFLTTLGIDKKAFRAEGSYPYLCQIYHDLQTMIPLLLQYRGTSHIYPFIQTDSQYDSFEIGDIHVKVIYLSRENQPKGVGFVIFDGQQYYVYGINMMLSFSHEQKEVALLNLEEGCFQDGQWQSLRILNGDERYNVYILDQPQMLSFQLHSFE